MKEIEIKFNGVTEKYIISDGEMTHYKALDFASEHNWKLMSVSELFEKDNDTGLPRLVLIKVAGAKCWVWLSDIYPFNDCRAYSAYLSTGYVEYSDRVDNFYALCRVGF